VSFAIVARVLLFSQAMIFSPARKSLIAGFDWDFVYFPL
jgi:hypothetical protein